MQVFTLLSSVFFRFDDEKVIFYNTDSFTAASFIMTPIIKEICCSLGNIDNLYTIPIYDEYICFCKLLVDSGFGIIHDEEDIIVSFPPYLTIRNDWDVVKATGGQKNAEVLKYLTEVVLFVGGRPDIYDELHYQTEYPYPGNTCMDYSLLSDFLDRVSVMKWVKLKFIFPYIEEFPNISMVLDRIKCLANECVLFVRDREYYGNRKAQSLLKNHNGNIVVINDAQYTLSRELSDSVENRFLIYDRNSEAAAVECVKKRHLSNFSFVAVYNGTNASFIRGASFPSEQELLSGSLSRIHLFAHRAINTFYFGRISITPNGNVYSNLMEAPIGTIQDTFQSIIINELDKNYSWRQTRYAKTGCQKCRLIDFCPSISPLEQCMEVSCIIKKQKDCLSAQKQ